MVLGLLLTFSPKIMAGRVIQMELSYSINAGSVVGIT